VSNKHQADAVQDALTLHGHLVSGFKRNKFPYQQTLTPAQQQTLLNELHVLYTEDFRFKDPKLWPATRDWLRRHFSGAGLEFPD
jgi:hypothetical protein